MGGWESLIKLVGGCWLMLMLPHSAAAPAGEKRSATNLLYLSLKGSHFGLLGE